MKTNILAQNLANLGVIIWIIILALTIPKIAIIIAIIALPPSVITSLDVYSGIKILK